MNRRRFFVQLSLVTFGVLGVLFFLHIFQPFSAFKIFSLVSVLFFLSMSIAMYFLAVKAALSKDKNAFTRLIMLFTFGKMLMTAVLVIVYHRLFQPASNFFLIPFFFIYIVFTVFETIFMTKLGKIKAR